MVDKLAQNQWVALIILQKKKLQSLTWILAQSCLFELITPEFICLLVYL